MVISITELRDAKDFCSKIASLSLQINSELGQWPTFKANFRAESNDKWKFVLEQ